VTIVFVLYALLPGVLLVCALPMAVNCAARHWNKHDWGGLLIR